VKAVYVFGRVYRHQHLGFVDMLRQRKLYKYAVDPRIVVFFADQVEKFLLACIGIKAVVV
jgi:hypothetical protein